MWIFLERETMCGIWTYLRLLKSAPHNQLELFKDFINFSKWFWWALI